MISQSKPFQLCFALCSLYLAFSSCKTDSGSKLPLVGPLFELQDSACGIDFVNVIKENQQINYYNYMYLYNGAGCAIGDLDNDGLPEAIFISNSEGIKVYHNDGDLNFRDITIESSIKYQRGWYTGVTLADVNGDGLLDIYACRSGLMETANRANLLYINNGDLTFTESAQMYRVNDAGFSTSANFFDYDKDGDLDLLVTNHPIKFPDKQEKSIEEDQVASVFETDHLFRCDVDHFTEVTSESGITNRAFGLSSMIGDLNGDGWLDIYTCNDFVEPDYMYFNNGDGTFTESIRKATKQISYYSMGVDIADINNDGKLDIFTADMAPEDHFREKLMMGSMNEELFEEALDRDKHYQYMYNAMQLNRGNEQFSNISAFANLAKSDWSWCPLICDLDNDGYKDVVVSNGVLRDVLDSDFRFRLAAKTNTHPGEKVNINPLEALNLYKSTQLKNYAFKNNGDLTFTKKTDEWGLTNFTFSNGMSYGDLDADGDLDIIVNNINGPASLYRNRSDEGNQNWIQFELSGDGANKFAFGARVTIETEKGKQTCEVTSSRGYLSSSQTIVHFGVGQLQKVKNMEITWPNGHTDSFENLDVNETHYIEQTNSNRIDKSPIKMTTELYNVDFNHTEDDYNDMDPETLIPYKISRNGPCLAVGDINNDQREDFFVGGATNQSGVLFIQNTAGTFDQLENGPWKRNSSCYDEDVVFADVDQDGDLDIYVVSGGSKNTRQYTLNQDHLYLNEGDGKFSEAKLPKIDANGSCVRFCDIDGDGDLDAFVGGRSVCKAYPKADKSYILINDKGNFEDKTEELAPDIRNVGMVNSAVWSDVDADGDDDLIVVGEWMPISIFLNDNGTLYNGTDKFGMNKTNGWWFEIIAEDIDGDGDDDYLVGNLGLNQKYNAHPNYPFRLDAGDLDGNGTNDIILSYSENKSYYPVRGRNCTSIQIPAMKEAIPTYTQFAMGNLDQLYGNNLNRGTRYLSHTFSSQLLLNNGAFSFKQINLPNEAQLAPINSIIVNDFNKDGIKEIVLAGNIHDFEAETPRSDAGIGCVLNYSGEKFTVLDNVALSLYANGNVKSAKSIKIKEKEVIIFGNNDDKLQFYFYPNGTDKTP